MIVARIFILCCLSGAGQLYGLPSEDCARCHADIAARYRLSPMARTSGRTAGSALERFDKARFSSQRGTARYEVSPQFTLQFSGTGVDGSRTLDYFLGAGLTGRSYLSSIDGFLYQTPAAWYSSRKAWDLSPGYEISETVNLSREIEPGCLQCHATGVAAIPGTTNGYRQPPWTEGGITCVRCHGVGVDHPHSNGSIFNPAKSHGQLRASTCAQCHLPGAVEIAKAGRAKSQFTPGSNLSDFVTTFIYEGADHQGVNQEATVNGHYEQLSRSACARASGDEFWCGTCHKIHSESNPRAACLTCHEKQPCTASQQVRQAKADNCLACHMPKRKATTVQHAAVTDHTIPRRPRTLSTPPTSDMVLVPFGGGLAASDRELGLAYASIALRDNNRGWGSKAVALLEKAIATDPSDPKVASALAQLYDRLGRSDAACTLYARAVQEDPSAIAARVNLGSCSAANGDLEGAMLAWQNVLRTNPGTESARLNLAVAQFKTGRIAEAKSTLAEALRFNPASVRARELLAGLQGR